MKTVSITVLSIAGMFLASCSTVERIASKDCGGITQLENIANETGENTKLCSGKEIGYLKIDKVNRDKSEFHLEAKNIRAFDGQGVAAERSAREFEMFGQITQKALDKVPNMAP